MRTPLPARAVLLLLPFCVAGVCRAEPPRPPGRPVGGPGGAGYAHESVVRARFGRGAAEYWLFEPAEPKPESAPVVVFLHGWGAMDPWVYGKWIEHIVRRGHVVVFPRYQGRYLSPASGYTPAAGRAVKEALAELGRGEHVRPDSEKLVAVGHSAGGLIAANLAVLAADAGLPPIAGIMCVQPGMSQPRPGRHEFTFPLADMGELPEKTLLVTVAAAADGICGDADARRMVRQATRVPARNKCFVLVRGDRHGRPGLRADHFAPCAADREMYVAPQRPLLLPRAMHGAALGLSIYLRDGQTVDALDHYAYWKLFDMLCERAMAGKKPPEDARFLLDTPAARDMGKWSDGRPVRQLEITNEP